MKNLNLLQKSGTLQIVKQQKINTTKTSLLILRQKVLSLCHYSDALGKFSKVGAGNNKDVA